jgi:DNA-binding transcriptional ArsR family regulator
MMTQVSKRLSGQQPPATPKQAARQRGAVDRHLDIELFKALSDPTRAKLLACLLKCGRPCSVTEVAECCSVDFSVVARHLTLLGRAGVVKSTKEGRTVWYQADAASLSARLRDLAAAVEGCCQAPTACCSEECC